MHINTEPYLTQNARWPQSGQHILAQYDDTSIIVYQAYRPSIGHFATRHGYFGGDFSCTQGKLRTTGNVARNSISC